MYLNNAMATIVFLSNMKLKVLKITMSQEVIRKGGGGENTIVSITVDDDIFAPVHLKHTTVSVSYNSKDADLVCNANAWWQQQTPVPPNDLTSLMHLHEQLFTQ